MIAFEDCVQLTDLELPENLETIKLCAFRNCVCLRRITLPLKDDMIARSVFQDCQNLTELDLVGGVHETVASLHMEGWRNEMMDEISRINGVLPTMTGIRAGGKTEEVKQWMRSVIRRLDHYKAEHCKLLKEATTLLELALWKAKIGKEGDALEREGIRTKRARKEICITSGASVVIKNVLPFLQLK